VTHDELLAKLWILPADVTELQHGAKAVQALRAVVELHKPDGSLCNACSHDTEILETYPCSTIQAIERELG
jgi:hypothetical protein